MTSVTDRPAETTSEKHRSRLLFMPELLGAAAIVSMWVAVLFTGVYGGDFVSTNAGATQSTTIPAAVFVAFFAALASIAVARRAFPRDTGSRKQPGPGAS